jgi:eukaryotic-like serine/threonine-protein kinase
MVDLHGSKHPLTREWEGAQGLAWSPDGNEIWFTATPDSDTDRPLYAVTRAGKQRLILLTPGGLYLEDIAADGRVLLRRDERRFQVEAGQIGGDSRALSWREIMLARAVSRDGTYALIGDETGKDYGAYLRKLDGSPAVLLVWGSASNLAGWCMGHLDPARRHEQSPNSPYRHRPDQNCDCSQFPVS